MVATVFFMFLSILRQQEGSNYSAKIDFFQLED